MTYSGFPYPLEELTGTARIKDGDITIENVTARNGQMHCTLNGTVKDADKHTYSTDMSVVAVDMPFDDKLVAALGPDGSAVRNSIRPEGTASAITTSVHRSPGGPMDYSAQVTLEADSPRPLAVTPKACPYRLEHVKGSLTVTPAGVVIEHFVGRHAQAEVDVTGRMDRTQGQVGLDLHISSARLPLNEDLRRALPERVGHIWERFSPVGAAAMDVHLDPAAAVGRPRLPRGNQPAGHGSHGRRIPLYLPPRPRVVCRQARPGHD